MASIGTDDEKLKFSLSVIGEVPREGFVDDGPVGMNSDLGMVRLLFQQVMDSRIWLNTEIMVFNEALLSWADSVEHLVGEGQDNSTTGFDNMICPHVLLNVQRREWTTYSSIDDTLPETHHVRYTFFAGLASTYLLGGGGTWDSGPGLWFEVEADALLAFARSLRAEIGAATSSVA